MTRLTEIRVQRTELEMLWPTQFIEQKNLEELLIRRTRLAALPENVFDGLTKLRDLFLHQNRITALPKNVFNGLANLEELWLHENRITALPVGVFDDLTDLRDLFLHKNRITALPEGVFANLANLRELQLHENRLAALPPGVFSGLSRLTRLHLRENLGSPFRLPLFLKPADPSEDLPTALLTFDPVQVNLVLPAGAPYSLDVGLEVSGVTLSTGQVTIPAGATQSETFTVTRDRGANSVEIGFAEMPAPPSNFDGFEIVGVPTSYTEGGAGPQVSEIRFISVPQNSGFYRPQLGEAVNVNVIFDRVLLVTIPEGGGASPPTLTLRIGDNQRTATYVPNRGLDVALISFSYTLTMDDDADEDGISVAAGGLQFNGSTVTDLFGRPADNTLADPLLADLPEHKVQWTAFLSFADSDEPIYGIEGSMADAVFNLDAPVRDPLVVRYAATGNTADADDYVAGSGEVTVPAGETTGTIRIFITDDTDVEPPRERFYLRIVDSTGYMLGAPSRIPVNVMEGVCDRTPQVRDAIVSGLGSSHCSDPDGDDLSEVASLALNRQSIASLKRKDFSGLTNLRTLELSHNALTDLPVGLLDGLGELETLNLHENQLETLQAGVFAGLGKMTRLRLRGNRLTSLPAGVFAGINRNVVLPEDAPETENLWLFLEGNELSSLSPGVFSGTDGLNWLNLSGNALDELPAGVFSGVPGSLRVLDLRNNSGAVFSPRLRVEFAGGPETPVSGSGEEAVLLKVTLREGAPYQLNFDIDVSSGQSSGPDGHIPVGSTESDVFTVTRTAGMGRTVVSLANISPSPRACELWQRSDGRCFKGLEINSAASMSLADDEVDPPVCDRTPEIRDAILRLWDGDDCMNVPPYIVRNVTHLDVSNTTLASFLRSDFNHMNTLKSLDFSGNGGLQTLGRGAFGSLDDLERLDLSSGGLRELHPRAFAGLTALDQLLLHDNDLRELPPEIFGGLDLGGASGSLRLEGNPDNDSPVFALTAEFRVVSFDGDVLEFHLYLPQGAPFNLSFPLTVQGAVSLTSATATMPAGSTQSRALTVTRQAGQTLSLSFDDPPALLHGDTGCGHDPCYGGFEIATGSPLYSALQSQVTGVEFTSSPRYSDDGYIAGVETITVDVIFDEELSLDTSGGSPTLTLQVGDNHRTAAYVQSLRHSNKLSFSYPLTDEDLDVDGVSVASADSLNLNGARVSNVLGPVATPSLAGFLSPAVEHKVRKGHIVSFETASVSGAEGETLDLVLTSVPTSTEAITVSYVVSYDNADADDHAPLSGNVEVPANAAAATIQAVIGDDTDVEPLRERFHLELTPSPNYILGTSPRLTIFIKEGVCDRTQQVQTAILGKLTGVDSCAAVTNEDLSRVSEDLELNSKGITSLKEGDFSGLANLQNLYLNHNQLSTLPPRVFGGLNQLRELRLQNNRLGQGDAGGTLPENLFAGLSQLRTLRLQSNQLSTLPAMLFSGLNNLQIIEMGVNRLSELPEDIFANNRVTNLILARNELRRLPDEVFFGLSSLQNLNFSDNQLSRIPAGAFSGYDDLRSLLVRNNPVGSLPRGVFWDLRRLEWMDLRNTGLTKLPPGVFFGLSRLGALHLGGNPAGDFEFEVRLALADDVQAPSLTSGPVALRATLREGAPYPLTLEIRASNGELSSTGMMLTLGSTQSESVTLTPNPNVDAVTVEFISLSPSSPPNKCSRWRKVPNTNGQCLTGFQIVFGGSFVLDDNLAAVSGVAIVSSPLQGDAYIGGNPGEEIVVEVGFDEPVEVFQAGDGNWPVLALEIGSKTRFAAYDENRSSATNLVFGYKPQGGDEDNDGISVSTDALRLNGAGILDHGVPVPLDLGAHAIENAPGHKVENGEAICDRTSQVQTAILEKLTGVDSCAAVTNEDLSGVSGDLALNSKGITSLKEGDFSSLTRVTTLDLSDNQLSTLPTSVFSGLGSLQEIRLQDNVLGGGDALGALRGTLPASLFNGLGNLRTLRLHRNQLSTLPTTIFSGLNSLETMDLESNRLAQLPDGIFSDNDSLRELLLGGNQLDDLPDEVFFDLEDLRTLHVAGSDLTELPAGAFAGYGEMRILRLDGNQLKTLPAGVFSDLDEMRTLRLDGNRLETLSADVFSGLTKLDWLDLRRNRLIELPAGIFSGISSLRVFHLGGNPAGDFEFRVRLERGDEAQVPSPASSPIPLRATLREGAPYSLTLGIQASNGELSSTGMMLAAGSTQSESVILTSNSNADSVSSVDFTSLSPSSPPGNCRNWQRDRGECFSGFNIVFGGPFVLDAESPPVPVERRLVNVVWEPDAITLQAGESTRVRIYTIPDLQGNERIAVYPRSQSVALTFRNRSGGIPSDGAPVVLEPASGSSAILTIDAGEIAADGQTTVSLARVDSVTRLGDDVDLNVEAALAVTLEVGPAAPVGLPVVTIAPESLTVSVGEGGTAMIIVVSDRALLQALTVGYTVGTDDDAGTVDADRDDYNDVVAGMVMIRANERRATIEIGIADDADAEPTREVFKVALAASSPGGLYELGASEQTTAIVVIEEGVCDRTGAVEEAIVTAAAGAADCAGVDDAILDGIDSLTLVGVFALQASDFSGLDALRELDFGNANAGSLPADVFSGVGDTLRVLNMRNATLGALPAGVFSGLMLDDLSLPATVALPFRFTVADESSSPDSVALRVESAPGAPFGTSVDLSTVNATLVSSSVSLPAGATRSETFTVSRANAGGVAVVRFAGVPAPVREGVRFDGTFDVEDEFVMGATTPVGVRIVSEPAGEFYAADETIRVEVAFGGDIHVSDLAGPMLALEVGGQTRMAHLASTGADTLIFEYRVIADDYDTDGVSILPDALTLGGGAITDASGGRARLELGVEAVMSAAAHRVAGRQLSLLLDLQTETVVAGSFSTVSLTLSGSDLPADGGEVAVSLTLDAGLEAPPVVTLRRASPSTRFRVFARVDAAFELSTLTASVAQEAQDLIPARVSSTALSVRIAPRVFSLSFVPPTVVVTAGRAPVAVELRLEEEAGSLTGTDSIPVLLSQSGELDLLSEGGKSLVEVALGRDDVDERISVGARFDATPGVQSLRAWVSDFPLNAEIREANLEVTVRQREISTLFEPPEIRLVRGGAAADMTSMTVTLKTEPELQGAETVSVNLSATGDLTVRPTAPVILSSVRNTVDISVEASGPGSGEVSATLDAAGSSLGNAVVSMQPLTIEVVRGVRLSLKGTGDSDSVTIIAGESTDVTVATEPLLEADESVTVTLNVAPGLTLVGGNRLVLTGMNRSATVRISALAPGLDLREGVSASGVGGNVEVVGIAPLRVVTRDAAEVSVSLSPSSVEIQQGVSTALRVTTDPQLGQGQSASLTLTITPDDAGLSFAGGSFSTTVALRGGEGRATSVDVMVSASPDAEIGAEIGHVAEVVSALSGSLGVQVNFDGRSRASLSVVTPRVTVGLTPEDGVAGDVLTLNPGADKAVSLSLTDFRLLGAQTARFVVSVVGEGLTLQGGVKSREVSLDASDTAAEVTVSASAEARAVGRLEVRAVGGVELSGGVRAAVLPIEVLQPVALRFVPASVLIERGRSTEFVVATTEALIAERAATVSLSIPGDGFRFAENNARHEVVLRAGEMMNTVEVFATAELGSTVAVSVMVEATAGIALGPLPGLELKATTPRAAVVFDPAELSLAQGRSESVEIGLENYPLRIPGQEVVLRVSVQGDLTAGATMQPWVEVSLNQALTTATVQVNAGAPGAATLTATAVSGVELTEEAVLPVRVLPEVSVRFEPVEVTVVQGRSTAFTVTLTPALGTDESAMVTLTAPEGFSFSGSPSLHLLFDGEQVVQHEVMVSAGAGAQSGMITAALEGTAGFFPAAVQPSLRVNAVLPQVAVAFDVDEAVLTIDAATEVTVRLDAGHGLQADQVAVLGLSVQGDRLNVAPPEVTLTAANGFAETITISATQPGVSGTLTVTAVSGVRLLEETTLPVRVKREFALSFEPEAMTLIAGGFPMQTTLVLTERGGSLAPGEEVEVTLTPSIGISVTSESGAPVTTVTLRKDVADATARATTRIRVSAELNAETPATLSASASADNAQVGGAALRVSVAQPGRATVEFIPGRVEVVQGHEAAFTVTTAPPLEAEQAATVELAVPADSGLTFEQAGGAPGASLTLRLAGPASTRHEVVISSSADAPVGDSMLSLTVSDSRGVDLAARSLPVDVMWPQATVALESSVGVGELVLARGSDATARLTLNTKPGLLSGQEAVLEVSVEGFGLSVAPDRVTLTADELSTEVKVSASAAGVNGVLTVAAVSGVRLDVPTLPVRVEREFVLSFEPETVALIAGGFPVSARLVLTEEGGSLAPGEEVVVTLTPSIGINVASASGAAVTTVTLRKNVADATTQIRVSAELNAETPATLSASASADNARVSGAALRVSVAPPGGALVEFIPERVEVVQGHEAAFTVTTNPPLEAGQSATVELAVPADSGLALEQAGGASGASLTLRLAGPASTRHEVVISSAPDAAVGDSMLSLTVSDNSGVELTPRSLPVDVVWPRATVALEPSVGAGELVPAAGSDATVRLTLNAEPELLPAQEAAFEVSVEGAGLSVAPRRVTLTATELSALVSVSAATAGVRGVLTVAVVSGVRLDATPTLPVRVEREFVLSFEPDMVALTAGGLPAPTTLILTEEAGSLEPGEEIVVTLTPSIGISVTSASGEPVTTVTLRKDAGDATARATTRIRVSAELDADYTIPGSLRASASADNARIGEARLTASVRQREIAVLFEPPQIRLVRGGAAADVTSKTVILKTEPELQGAETVSVNLDATGDLTATPAEPVILSSIRNTAAINVEASGPGAGEVFAMVEMAGSSFGNAVVTSQSLAVEVVRGVRLSLKGAGDSDSVTIVAGKSAYVTVATEPSLEADESVTVTLSVASGLMIEGASLPLIGDNGVVLTGMNQSATVRLSASVPELDLPAGASASGAGGNVAVLGDASFRVMTEAAVEVAAVLRPSEMKIQQGTSTMLRVTTDPQLGQGQSVSLTLEIVPDDGGMSFADDSFGATVELAGGEGRSPAVDVTVKASPDAAIGSVFRITLALTGNVGVEATIGEQTTLTVTPPRVTVGFTPEGGNPGDVLTLDPGSSRKVTLRLTDFSLSGGQQARFNVSVEGEGLTLQGKTSLDVSLDAIDMTAEVTVSASEMAERAGRLVVRAIGGVELSEAAVLRIDVSPPPDMPQSGVRLRIRVFLEGALE